MRLTNKGQVLPIMRDGEAKNNYGFYWFIKTMGVYV